MTTNKDRYIMGAPTKHRYSEAAHAAEYADALEQSEQDGRPIVCDGSEHIPSNAHILHEHCDATDRQAAWHRRIQNRPDFKPVAPTAEQISNATVATLLADLHNADGKKAIKEVLDNYADLERIANGKPKAVDVQPFPYCVDDVAVFIGAQS